MCECISPFCLTIIYAPPPKDWKGKGGTISEIVSTLRSKTSQRQRVEDVIAATHHAHHTGEEYNSMKAFQAGTHAIEDDSIEQQMVANLREQGLSFTDTTILSNQDCIKTGRMTVT